MNNHPLLRLEGISKSFGPVQALKAVDLTVQANEIQIEYARDAHQALQNKNVLLTASYNGGSVSWTCSSPNIDNNRLPAYV
ncbi:MAG: pilin, partial [Anaerolineae bacterium]